MSRKDGRDGSSSPAKNKPKKAIRIICSILRFYAKTNKWEPETAGKMVDAIPCQLLHHCCYELRYSETADFITQLARRWQYIQEQSTIYQAFDPGMPKHDIDPARRLVHRLPRNRCTQPSNFKRNLIPRRNKWCEETFLLIYPLNASRIANEMLFGFNRGPSGREPKSEAPWFWDISSLRWSKTPRNRDARVN